MKFEPTFVNARAVTGNNLKILGAVQFQFLINNEYFPHYVFITNDDTKFHGKFLLGTDFLSKFNFNLNNNHLILNNEQFPLVRSTNNTESVSFIASNVCEQLKYFNDHSFGMKTAKNSFLQPGHINIISVKLPNTPGKKYAKEDIDVLFKPHLSDKPNKYIAANCISHVKNNEFFVSVINLSESVIKIKKNTYLGVGTIFSADHNRNIQIDHKKINTDPNNKHSLNPEHINLGSISESNKHKFFELIQKHKYLFHSPNNPIGALRGHQARIYTTDEYPIYKKQFRTPVAYEASLRKHINDLLKMDIIETSSSSWNSPIFCISKNNHQKRWVLDLRHVNQRIKPQRLEFPSVQEIISRLHGKKIFSTLDLTQAYNQLSLDPRDRHKVAFRANNKIWQFKRLCFGLIDASVQFSIAMNAILQEHLNESCFVYIDDVIVFSENEDDHLRNLEKIFTTLNQANARLSLHKCHFFKREIQYLGHRLSKEGVQPLHDKTEAISKIKNPSNKKELKSFLATINFYRNHVLGFSQIAKPLYDLLKDNIKFVWKQDQQTAFDELKRRLQSAPILRYPNFEKSFTILTDASLHGLGAVLTQEYNGKLFPVAYYSSSLSKAEKNYAIVELEALSVLRAVLRWETFLAGKYFKVLTDHKPLLTLFNTKTAKNKRILRYSIQLSEFEFDIQHIRGKDNLIADLLSRNCSAITQVGSDEDLLNIPEVHDRNLKMLLKRENILKLQNEDKFCNQVKNLLLKNTKFKMPKNLKKEQFSLENDILYFSKGPRKKKVLVIPEKITDEIIKSVHASHLNAHLGFLKTIYTLKNLFFIRKVYTRTKFLVKICEYCQKRKASPTLKTKLGTCAMETKPNQTISIDLVGKLGQSRNGYQYILTTVDNYSKFFTAYALKSKSAEEITNRLKHHFLTFGTYNTMLMDNSQEFRSAELKKLCEQLGTKAVFISPYHPASNGILESKHQSFIDVLSYITKSSPQKWDEKIDFASYILNISYHSKIHNCPFTVHNGRAPNYNLNDVVNNYSNNHDEIDIQELNRITKQSIEKETDKEHSKTSPNISKNISQKLVPGQKVLIKNFTRKNVLHKHFPFRKFSNRFAGPYIIDKVINDQTSIIRSLDDPQKKIKVHNTNMKLFHE